MAAEPSSVTSPPSSSLSNASSDRSSPPLPAAAAAGVPSAEYISLRRLSANLEGLLADLDPDLTDADIVFSDGDIVPVHRCILAARSGVFHDYFARFSSSSRSPRRGVQERPQLMLEHFVPRGAVRKDAFVVFLGFLYTGKLLPFPEEITTCADSMCAHDACRPAIMFVVELAYAASAFQLEELVSIFQRRLLNFVEKVMVEDVAPILHVAFHAKLSTLLTSCIQRISKSTLDSLYIEKELPHDVAENIRKMRSLSDQNNCDSHIVNPIHDKCVRRIQRALDSDDVELVKLFLNESKITLDDANALHYAAAYCDPKVVKDLVEFNLVNVNLKNSRGCAPLHLAAMRREPAVIVALLTKNPIVSLTTSDGLNAISICKRLTRFKDYNARIEQGQESNKYRLCIDILEREMMRSAMAEEDSITSSSSLFTDELHTKLVYLENRVAFARSFFPAEAKVAMQIAEANKDSEFTGICVSNNLEKLMEVDLNETPTIRNMRLRDRVEVLMRTVELGRRYFPNCSQVLDKFLEDDRTSPFFVREDATERQSTKKMCFSDLKKDVNKAFSKDKAETVLPRIPSLPPLSVPTQVNKQH